MFGVLRGCSPQLSPASHQEWWGHICGLCLALRDQAGQSSRVTTNFDAAALSVLYAAQRAEAGEQRSSVCPLRGMRRLDVVSGDDAGARYAAAVSLLMASTRIRDAVSDGDGWVGRVPRLAGLVARRWDAKAARIAAESGFDPGLIRAQTAAQLEVEQIEGADFAVYAAPTEAASGAAFRHTAILAGQPGNAEALEQIGRMYGRMMLLLDSYADLKEDAAHGRFNALAGCPASEVKRYAQSVFDEAMAAIRRHWQQLSLPRPALAETLLLGMLPTIGARTLRTKSSAVCLTAAPIMAAPLLSGPGGGNQPPGYYDPNNPQGYYDPNQPQGYYDPNQPQGYYDPNNPYNNPVPPPPQPQRSGGCGDGVAAGLAVCCVNPFRRRGHRHGHKSRCCCDGCDCCDCCDCCHCGCHCADCCTDNDGCNGCDGCCCDGCDGCDCCSCDCS